MFQLLPPSDVYIDARNFNKMEACTGAPNGWATAMRALLRGVFSDEELAASSALGKRSHLPALDADRLETVKCKC